MNGWLTIVAVAIGGGLGAALRGAAEALATATTIPGWTMILLVNVLGSAAMGFLFVWLELRLRKDGLSRLACHPRNHLLRRFAGLLQADPTITPAELARHQARLRVASGFLLTGFLGGLTTFSSYALDVVNLGISGQWLWLIADLAGCVMLACIAVLTGLEVGIRLLASR